MDKTMGFVNGTILTMDPALPACEGILVRGDTIAARASRDQVLEICRKEEGEIYDLAGATLLPGFHDCHVHMMGTGLNALGIDLYDCSSVKEVLARVAEAAAASPPDHWVFGKRLDESRLAEGRPPTMAELDRIAPHHPVYLVDRGWHYTIVNSRAFRRLELSPALPGIRRTAGEINGRLNEKANALAKRRFFNTLDQAQRETAFRFTATEAVKKGITTIHAMEGGILFADSDIPDLLNLKEQLPVRVILYWATENLEAVKKAGLPRMGGDILLDGSIGSRTAAFPEPYSDDPTTSGVLYYSNQRVRELIENAHREGLQIAFHAIGEKAITQALDCFEAVLARYPKTDHRHRIEHFGFPARRDIERAARLGIVISTQPSFTYLRGGPGTVYNTRLGTERERRGYPLRAFLDAGIVVGGGSDSDVTPMDPLLGIHAAVNPPYPENKVTVEEALAMFTREAAKIAFQEHQTGTIEEGKLADLVILDHNPLLTEAASLKDITVLATMKGGKWVYKKE